MTERTATSNRGLDLSVVQQEILIPGRRLVLACPGAGKTRAIVARYMVRDNGSSRGKALLSFTNRAVDEARARCQHRPELLTTPNFVGTFDSFIHRFIVTPWYLEQYGVSPNYFSNYREVRIRETQIRYWRTPGAGIGLWNFRMASEDTAEAIESTMLPTERAHWNAATTNRTELCKSAYNAIRSLVIDDGLIDCQSARFIAAAVLGSVQGEPVLERLALRFSEVIVDEAQDCDESEVAILRLLEERGVPVVVVADINQAIYGFRGGNTEAFESYAAEFGESERTQLTQNYRSSVCVCGLVSSLVMGEEITSAADLQGIVPEQIYLLRGSDSDKVEKFLDLLQELAIVRGDAIVLAHTWAVANRIGGRTEFGSNGSYMNVLIRQVRESADVDILPQERSRSTRRLEEILLELYDWNSVSVLRTRESLLNTLGRDEEWLREIRAGVVHLISDTDDRDLVAARTRNYLCVRLRNDTVALRSLSHVVKKPDLDEWNALKGSVAAAPRLQSSTVHSAKGGEWEAVLLEVASNRREDAALRKWRNGEMSEEVRVLYVGCSRAKRLLALSQGAGSSENLHEILKEKGVPVAVL